MRMKKGVDIFLGFVLAVVFVGGMFVGEGHAEEKTFHFAHVHPPQESPYHNYVYKFKEIVESKIEGRIKIIEHPAMELGSEREYIEACQMGTLDMATANASVFTTFTPSLDWAALYFVITNADQAARVLKNDKVVEKLQGLQDISLMPLSYISDGVRGTFTRNKLIERVSDLKGLKIRVMETPIHVTAWAALGAIPTPLAYGELYTALQYGTVDGAENPLTSYRGVKFYEPAPYFAFTNHQWGVNAAFMSKVAWKKLTSAEQEIFKEAAIKALDYNLERQVIEEKKHIEELGKMGVRFAYPEIDEFKEKVIPALKKYEEKVGEEFVEMVRNL